MLCAKVKTFAMQMHPLLVEGTYYVLGIRRGEGRFQAVVMYCAYVRYADPKIAIIANVDTQDFGPWRSLHRAGTPDNLIHTSVFSCFGMLCIRLALGGGERAAIQKKS